MLSRYRSFIRGKTRIAFAWSFVILLGLTARQYPTPPGIILCFIGAALRFWASGYIRKDSRPAVGGPYSLVRNPLYLGTYLMAVGTAWAIGNAWLLLAVSVLFAIVYHFIILDEESKLRDIFGEPYLKYCKLVPRFFPRFWPVSRGSLSGVNSEHAQALFSWELAMKNKAYEAFVSFAGLMGFVALTAYLWQNW
jgi:hypothetical protein